MKRKTSWLVLLLYLYLFIFLSLPKLNWDNFIFEGPPFCSNHVLVQTFLSLCARALDNILSRKVVMAQSKYWSLSVVFLYTIVDRVLSCSGVITISTNGIAPSCLVSSVLNWIWGSMEFICSRHWFLSSIYFLDDQGIIHMPSAESGLIRETCWWPWLQSSPWTGWPELNMQVTPWLLLVLVLNTYTVTRFRCSWGKSPAEQWCWQWTLLFCYGVLHLVWVFFLTILTAECTCRYVNNILTSYEVIHFPCSILCFLFAPESSQCFWCDRGNGLLGVFRYTYPQGLWFISDYNLKPAQQIFSIDNYVNLTSDTNFLYCIFRKLWLENEQHR